MPFDFSNDQFLLGRFDNVIAVELMNEPPLGGLPNCFLDLDRNKKPSSVTCGFGMFVDVITSRFRMKPANMAEELQIFSNKTGNSWG